MISCNGDLISLGYVDVGLLSEYIGRPKRIKIEKRNVAVWIYNNEPFALDANCYHSAGALENHVEDIEEIDGNPCIRCPQHKYIISLRTGDSYYEPVKIHRDAEKNTIKVEKLDWKSKGIMQRVHDAKIFKDRLYIKLSEVKEELPSDRYAFKL